MKNKFSVILLCGSILCGNMVMAQQKKTVKKTVTKKTFHPPPPSIKRVPKETPKKKTIDPPTEPIYKDPNVSIIDAPPSRGIDVAVPPQQYDVVDVPAEFPGGRAKMISFIGNNIEVPMSDDVQGRNTKVIVKFVIDEQGNVVKDKIIIENSVPKPFANEAIRVISRMPKWTPAMKDGKPVKSTFRLPIQFQYEE